MTNKCKSHAFVIDSLMAQLMDPLRYHWKCVNCDERKWMTLDQFKVYCYAHYAEDEIETKERILERVAKMPYGQWALGTLEER